LTLIKVISTGFPEGTTLGTHSDPIVMSLFLVAEGKVESYDDACHPSLGLTGMTAGTGSVAPCFVE
jgi:hypothetical protein